MSEAIQVPRSEDYVPSFPDPFSAAHAALWRVIDSDNVLAAEVGPKNRVRTHLDAYRAPRPGNGVGDVPEIVLSQAAFAFPRCKPEEHAIVSTQQFTLLATTDRINWTKANLVKWRLYVRMWETGYALGTGCLIGGWTFDGSDALSANEPTAPNVRPSEYRATVIGRITLFLNLTRSKSIDPNALY